MTTAPATKTTTPRKRPAKTTQVEPEGPRMISEAQMRHLNGLITSRTGWHARDDVLDYLCVALGRDVETRNSITFEEADGLIDHLGPLAPGPVGASDPRLRALRAPFPGEAIGKLPRSTCRECAKSQRKRCDRHQWVANCPECHGHHSAATMHIDYVGHADVTARLLAVDPLWTWEPIGRDQFGLPALDRDGNLWINLTILGVTRPGVGDAGNGKGMKECIGDALRNAAMRFGVALDLWAKGDRDWAQVAGRDDIDPAMDPAQPVEPAPPYDGPPVGALLTMLEALASEAGKTLEEFTATFRAEQGGLSVDDLHRVEPDLLNALVVRIESWLRRHPPVAPAE